jgi:ABC-type multidrug transport system fused ATPase/permease subunit
VDGTPLEEYRLDSWLSRIGLVSQEPFVYHSTVTENIAFGRPGYSSSSIIEAAKIANAHGFISELPQGYDTVVGEMGMKLSGGQQQRIAIARSVLTKPDILIFDEATSSLDTLSEKLVQQAIDNVSKDCTVIIIAHRISTVRNADKIIVLEQGRVIEEGDHQQLLQQEGYYSSLVTSSS